MNEYLNNIRDPSSFMRYWNNIDTLHRLHGTHMLLFFLFFLLPKHKRRACFSQYATDKLIANEQVYTLHVYTYAYMLKCICIYRTHFYKVKLTSPPFFFNFRHLSLLLRSIAVRRTVVCRFFSYFSQFFSSPNVACKRAITNYETDRMVHSPFGIFCLLL